MALQKLLDNPELESVFVEILHKNYWQYEDGIPTRLKPWMSKYESRQVREKFLEKIQDFHVHPDQNYGGMVRE